MKVYIPLTALVLLLSGCSDRPKFKDDVNEIVKLTPAAQFAIVAENPLLLAAFALVVAAGNGVVIRKIVKVKRQKPEAK